MVRMYLVQQYFVLVVLVSQCDDLSRVFFELDWVPPGGVGGGVFYTYDRTQSPVILCTLMSKQC